VTWTIEKFEESSMPEPNSGCWIWLKYARKLKGSVYLQPWAGMNGKAMPAARISWMLYRGPIQNGLCVLHTCHNSLCVNPAHLYLGDKRQNWKDMVRAGRCRGSHSGPSKEQVIEARRLRADGARVWELAGKYGITPKAMSRILTGGRWKLLELEGG
jgi:hypothetical protein